MPPITRAWFVAVLATTCACSFGLVNPSSLILHYDLVVNKFEIWRLASNFVFIGPFSFPFVIQLYMLYQYSMQYETNPFNTGAGGTSADYAWMLVIGALLLCGIGFVLSIPLLGQGLTFMVMYVWSRKNPEANTSLFSFSFKAFYLPMVLIGFNVLIGNPVQTPLCGIAAGHAYYFLHYICPSQYQFDIIHTPSFLIQWFGGRPSQRPPGLGGSGQQQGAPRGPYAGHSWGSGRVLGGR